MFTHGAKRGNLNKITHSQTSIVHECFFLLAFESGETCSNRQSYVLLAICNIQIVSFFVVCLLALTISYLLHVCISIFIFHSWPYFLISFLFSSTLFHFYNFHFLCEHHMHCGASSMSFKALCSFFVVHNFSIFLSYHYKLLAIIYFSFKILIVLYCLHDLLTKKFKFIMIMVEKNTLLHGFFNYS